jgi:hypothetical protein
MANQQPQARSVAEDGKAPGERGAINVA